MGDLPPELINKILDLAHAEEAESSFSSRSIYDAAVYIATKSKLRYNKYSMFIRDMYRHFLIEKLWLCLRIWLMTKHSMTEGKKNMFNLEIEVMGEDRTISFDSIVMKENVLPNGGGSECFYVDQVYFFMFQGKPGLIHKSSIYEIFSIQVPGYKMNNNESNSLTFASPTKKDVLKIKAKFFTKLPKDITTKD